MRTHSKLVFAGLAATLLMAVAVTSASARNLSISNQNFRIVWTELIFSGGSASVTCPVTLEGTFHYRSIMKSPGALIGYVTRAISGSTQPPCRGGTATVDSETLPWHVTYRSFAGALPAIEKLSILLHSTSFHVTPVILGISVACAYRERGAAEENAAGIATREAGGAITTVRADETILLAKYSGSSSCPTSGGFRGTGEAFVLGTNTRITLTLI